MFLDEIKVLKDRLQTTENALQLILAKLDTMQQQPQQQQQQQQQGLKSSGENKKKTNMKV